MNHELRLFALLLALGGCGADDASDDLAEVSDTVDATDSTDATDTVDATDSTDATDTVDTTETDTESESTSDTTGDTTDETTSDTTGETGVVELSFAADVYPIFMDRCSCHIANSPGMLAMPDAATAYANLVDVVSAQVALDRVEPGDPEASHLYKKITGTQSFGATMPSVGAPLGADEIATVEAWIAGGALE